MAIVFSLINNHITYKTIGIPTVLKQYHSMLRMKNGLNDMSIQNLIHNLLNNSVGPPI